VSDRSLFLIRLEKRKRSKTWSVTRGVTNVFTKFLKNILNYSVSGNGEIRYAD